MSSAFGWHIFRVSAVEPEETVPLEEARAELARELALEEASNRLPDFAAQLDDELAAGTELAEAARVVGLQAVKVPAVDATGKDPDGAPVAALPPWPEFMQVALETPAGETSLLEETDAGYFVIQVDQVMEPRLKPVEEVRDELRQAWQDERRRELARARAEELRAQLDDGAAADELLADAGFETKPIEPLRRDQTGADQGLNQAVVRALFATAPGEIAGEVVELGGRLRGGRHRRGDRRRPGRRCRGPGSAGARGRKRDALRPDRPVRDPAPARLSGRDRWRRDQSPDRLRRARAGRARPARCPAGLF